MSVRVAYHVTVLLYFRFLPHLSPPYLSQNLPSVAVLCLRKKMKKKKAIAEMMLEEEEKTGEMRNEKERVKEMMRRTQITQTPSPSRPQNWLLFLLFLCF
jgi:hypothetical protein